MIEIPVMTDQLPKAFHEEGGSMLRPAQMVDHEQDIRAAKAQLENPTVQDKGTVRTRLRALTKQFEAQAPRPITDGALKDKLAARSQELLDQITPGMLSKEEMRKNPAGAVGRFMRWERSNKRKILEWKKIQVALSADQSNPNTWDRDAANLERYRPEGPQDRFRGDAQINGVMSYGSISDPQWQRVFGTVHPETSALNQAMRAQDAVGAGQTATPTPKPVQDTGKK